jgi:hypothetical protein
MLRATLLDEVGYLSYSNRHADLLFELVSRRYGVASTVVTTNRCDRRRILSCEGFRAMHQAVNKGGDASRVREHLMPFSELEARERAEQRTKKRSAAKAEKRTS